MARGAARARGGAVRFTLFDADHGTAATDTLRRWALEIAPAVREAVGRQPMVR